MAFTYPVRACVVGLLAAAPMGAFAQGQRPVAVPIVGSPAAEQPKQPTQQPPAPPAPQAPGFVIPTFQGQPPAPPAPAAASPAASVSRGQRKLELSFKDGTIALDAENVTIRDILTEWQRRDGCQFVNADKLPASPMTIQFPAGTPELDAIDSLLRGLGTPTSGYGYIVAPGSAPSVCGAVYIVPSSRPTAAAAYASPAASPVAAPVVVGGSPDTELPPVIPFMPTQPTQPAQPTQPPPYTGAAIPGMTSQPGRGSNTPPQSPGFGPIAPTAPGAGRLGAPAPTPTPSGPGRGGQ